jgi:flagellar hook protein FlgE
MSSRKAPLPGRPRSTGDAGCTRALVSWSLAFWGPFPCSACLTEGESRPTYDPGSPFADADGQVAYPNVDLTEEAIQQLVARYTFAANARVVTAYDQMVKSLVDISA